MSNFQRKSVYVVTDRSFPRGLDGNPDAARFDEWMAFVSAPPYPAILLVVDGDDEDDDVLGDEDMLALARERRWNVVSIDTTCHSCNPYEQALAGWLRRSKIAVGNINFYGWGLWA